MRKWNLKEPQERLELYEIALKDWNKYDGVPIGIRGFCDYFADKHNIALFNANYFATRIDDNEVFKKKLPELYNQRTTNERCNLHYPDGVLIAGARARIQALKNAIKEVELLLIDPNQTKLEL